MVINLDNYKSHRSTAQTKGALTNENSRNTSNLATFRPVKKSSAVEKAIERSKKLSW